MEIELGVVPLVVGADIGDRADAVGPVGVGEADGVLVAAEGENNIGADVGRDLVVEGNQRVVASVEGGGADGGGEGAAGHGVVDTQGVAAFGGRRVVALDDGGGGAGSSIRQAGLEVVIAQAGMRAFEREVDGRRLVLAAAVARDEFGRRHGVAEEVPGRLDAELDRLAFVHGHGEGGDVNAEALGDGIVSDRRELGGSRGIGRNHLGRKLLAEEGDGEAGGVNPALAREVDGGDVGGRVGGRPQAGWPRCAAAWRPRRSERGRPTTSGRPWPWL